MIKTKKEEIKSAFLKDVKDHEMIVKHDHGIYRHLVFSRKESSIYRFEIVTWPGYLCVCGDMGDFVFCRSPDMFKFFRDDEFKINVSYYAEKCVSGKVKAFDHDIVNESCNDYLNYLNKEVYNCDSKPLEEDEFQAREETLKEIDRIRDSYDVYEAIDNLRNAYMIDSEDYEFFKFEDYSYHFIWLLFAIVYGISEYDKFKIS